MNRDSVTNIHPHKALTAAYDCVSHMQKYSPQMQVAVCSILFRQMAESSGMNASELMHYADRLHSDQDVWWIGTKRALTEYIKNEIRGN
jgi:cytidylate kinase